MWVVPTLFKLIVGVFKEVLEALSQTGLAPVPHARLTHQVSRYACTHTPTCACRAYVFNTLINNKYKYS